MSDETSLIEESRRGSESAFSELVRLHQVQIRSYLARFIRDRDLIFDIAQETFLAAYRSLASYRGEAPFRLWLIAIARNRALTHLREEERRRTQERVSLSSTLAGWVAERLAANFSDPTRHDHKLAALRTCMDGLAPASADLVTRYYEKGLNAEEIARETGKRESAVWMALSRIRQALRQCVQVRLAGAGEKP